MARHRVPSVEDEQEMAGLTKHTLERGGETESRLRNKLRTAGTQIETVVGLGYRFVD